MGNRKLGLLILFFMFLHVFELSSVLHKPLQSESLRDSQLSNEDKNQHQHHNRNNDGDNYGRSVVHVSKIAHGGLGGETGSKSTGSGENGNGGSHSPYGQGGTSVIPIYAGGAAINHHPNTHHGAGHRIRSGFGLLALILTAFTSLVHLCTEC